MVDRRNNKQVLKEHQHTSLQKKDYLFNIYSEGTFGLAFWTGSDFDLSLSILEKGPKNGSTLDTIILHLLQLREDS
jgi:hypothetical protein